MNRLPPGLPNAPGYPPAPPMGAQPAPQWGPPPAPNGYPPAPQAAPQYPGVPAGYGAPPWQGAPQPGGHSVLRGGPMGAMSGMGHAIAAGHMAGTRFPFFELGQHLVIVRKTLETTQNKNCFVAECEIADSQVIEPGQMRSWVQKLEDRNIAYPSILRFAVCGLGFTSKEEAAIAGFDQYVLGDVINALSDPENQRAQSAPPNPFNGIKMWVNVYNKTTRKNTNFTQHDWFPAS